MVPTFKHAHRLLARSPRDSRAAYPVALALAALLQACGGSSDAPAATTPPPPPPPQTSAGELQLDSAAYEVDESTTTVGFTVIRTGGSDGEVSVDISTSDGTAAAGDDYGSITTTASFADGDTQAKTGTFIVFDDNADEADETVILTLAAVTGGATIGAQDSAVVTIRDDDPTPHTVGGTIEGLSGAGLLLRNNDGDEVPIAMSDQSFTFPELLVEGDAYNVIVATQPWAPAQSCEVTNGSGTIGSADVTDVLVTCADVPLQSLIFSRRIGGQSDLLTTREDGGNFATLADSVDHETFAAFAGDRILFRRFTSSSDDIYSILLDGTDLQPIAIDPAPERFGALSADGSRLVFDRQAGPTAATDDVYVIGLDGAGLLPLAITPEDEEFRGIATGAGERVIYGRTVNAQEDIHSVNIDGTDDIAIADSADFEIVHEVTQGGRVVFQRLSGGEYDLYSVNADGTGMAALSTKAGHDEFVALLDGERVLYRNEAAASQYDLYAVNADGTEHVTIADDNVPEHFDGVTPTGRIVFRRLLSGHNDIYAVNADGTGMSTLAATSYSESFIGALDDGRVVYVRTDPADTELTDLFVVGADGSGTFQLTDTPEREEMNSMVFLAGDRLVFERQVEGQQDIFSIRTDGTDERRLTDDPDVDERPVGITSSGGVIYHARQGTEGDLYRIGADGNGFAVISATVEDESLQEIF